MCPQPWLSQDSRPLPAAESLVDRTTSPWRALEDPGGLPAPTEPSNELRLRPSRLWLAGGALAVVMAIVGGIVVLGSGGSPVVTVSASGGDSPDFSPGDGTGSVAAGGDGGGASGQLPDPSAGDPDPSSGPVQIVVEVAGAVARPGVYDLAAGARVADAIAAAGGYGPRIDLARATTELNLAARVADGDRIIVPSRDDPPATAGSGPATTSAAPSAPAKAGPVDLNRATADELDALPGVGPVTVAKIIASRTEHAFRSVSDLLSRKLVGSAEFAKIRKLVTVG
jgi:competence protein ComEA